MKAVDLGIVIIKLAYIHGESNPEPIEILPKAMTYLFGK